MIKSLYQIEKEYQNIADILIENEGEITPEIENSLQINEVELQKKAICYGQIIKSFEYDEEILETEIKRLTALKKQRSNTVAKLKETLSNAMDLYQITEIKTPLMKINFRKSESVECEMLVLDEKYIREKVIREPDKNKIKEDLKVGIIIEGAELIEKKNIQIK